MRSGSFVKWRTRFAAVVAAATISGALPATLLGQLRGAYPGERPAQRGGPQQAVYYAPNAMGGQPAPYVDRYGNTMVVPAGYGAPCDEGYYGDGGCYEGYGPECYGDGTDPSVAYPLMEDVGMAGAPVDQRGPHYFDVRAEAIFLQRDETYGPNQDFTVDNVGGPVILSSNQLDYGTDAGFRILGRYDICPLAVLEFGYTGLLEQESSVTVRDPDEGTPGFVPDLFSVFSEFGTNPATVAVAGGPMPETERAIQHSISIESDLQTGELSYRRYWLGYHPCISGTLLAGFRYTKLTEEFIFSSIGGDPPQGLTEVGLEYSDQVENHLAGFQTGGDIWFSLVQGLRIGAEGKVGIYNNHATLENHITTTPVGTTPPTLFEEFDSDHGAFIGELSADIVADILPSLSIRAGYELLFLNELALAGDNFNTTSPYDLPGGPVRDPFFDHDSDAFYHGGHVGIEYIW
jgi:hypothetical protein